METERLLIQDWKPADWELFHPIVTDPEVMRFIGTGEILSDERVQRFIATQISNRASRGFCIWKLIHKASDRLVGHCGLQKLGNTVDTEIGWLLARDQWGQGLATEAARRVLCFGFEALGLERIVAIAQPDNEASINIMRKLGMGFEKKTNHGELGLSNAQIEVVLYSKEL